MTAAHLWPPPESLPEQNFLCPDRVRKSSGQILTGKVSPLCSNKCRVIIAGSLEAANVSCRFIFFTPVSGYTYFAGVDPEQDIHSKIRKRNITKAARPTQKAMTMESVDTAQEFCQTCFLRGKNKRRWDDLSSLVKVRRSINWVSPFRERNPSANLSKVLEASWQCLVTGMREGLGKASRECSGDQNCAYLNMVPFTQPQCRKAERLLPDPAGLSFRRGTREENSSLKAFYTKRNSKGSL